MNRTSLILVSLAVSVLAGCPWQQRGPDRPKERVERATRHDRRVDREEPRKDKPKEYLCQSAAGEACKPPRFIAPSPVGRPQAGICSGETLVVAGKHPKAHSSEGSRLAALSPDTGEVRWQHVILRSGFSSTRPQLAVARDRHIIVALQSPGQKLLPGVAGHSDVVLASWAPEGKPRWARKLPIGPDTLSQSAPAMVAGDRIYVALGEKIQLERSDEHRLVLYVLGLDGRLLRRSDLRRIGSPTESVRWMSIARDGAVWLRFHKRLIRCDPDGEVLDRYPLDYHRSVAGFGFASGEGVWTLSTGRGSGDNKHTKILWLAKPGAPMLQIAEGRYTWLEDAGGRTVNRTHLNDNGYLITPLGSGAAPDPAYEIHNGGHHFGWCDNGDVILHNKQGLMRQPLLSAPARIAR